MSKYVLVGMYRVEEVIETNLEGRALTEHCAKLLHSDKYKFKAYLLNSELLNICECGERYGSVHTPYCGQCGRRLGNSGMRSAKEVRSEIKEPINSIDELDRFGFKITSEDGIRSVNKAVGEGKKIFICAHYMCVVDEYNIRLAQLQTIL